MPDYELDLQRSTIVKSMYEATKSAREGTRQNTVSFRETYKPYPENFLVVQAPLQNKKIQNRFRSMPRGQPAMRRTLNPLTKEPITVTHYLPGKLGDAPLTPNTAKISSVHERRCKADEQDE